MNLCYNTLMAAIRLLTGKLKVVSPEFGATMWQIKNAEITGTAGQRKFADKVGQVYLNPANAPKSYTEQLEHEHEHDTMQVRLPYVD